MTKNDLVVYHFLTFIFDFFLIDVGASVLLFGLLSQAGSFTRHGGAGGQEVGKTAECYKHVVYRRKAWLRIRTGSRLSGQQPVLETSHIRFVAESAVISRSTIRNLNLSAIAGVWLRPAAVNMGNMREQSFKKQKEHGDQFGHLHSRLLLVIGV